MFVISLVTSFILTRGIRRFAISHAWVSPPGSDRHLHRRPLPRIGGVAIFFSFLISCSIAIAIVRLVPDMGTEVAFKPIIAILAPASLVFLLGVYDDFRPVGPYPKFAVQGIAALMLFAGGLRIHAVPVLFGSHHFPWFVELPLTVLWVLAVTNAFNLIDGLDGLAAGSALFSTLVVFVVSLSTESSLVTLMTVALVGAIAGFLRFNFNPATIFLGDCGSLFIGFTLSALALQGTTKSPTIIAIAIPVVSFGLPILETALSIVRRLIGGRSVFSSDREHIHHKLLQLGLSHRQVVIVLYGVSAVFGLLSLFLLWPASQMLGLVLAVIGAGVWIGVQHLGYLEFGELRRVAQKTIERQRLINNLAVRKAIEELKASKDYAQICRALVAGFSGNEFDAFDLLLHNPGYQGTSFRALPLISAWDESPSLRWVNPESFYRDGMVSAWTLNLELLSSRNHRRGSMIIYRLESNRDLQVDLNLLTANFPVALADALERAMLGEGADVPHVAGTAGILIAQAS
jgi:UDP-GlcNAc:undecaprenyl-phosphate/decaprenyl-phosphate GlcNAc-1-phosphate transferase